MNFWYIYAEQLREAAEQATESCSGILWTFLFDFVINRRTEVSTMENFFFTPFPASLKGELQNKKVWASLPKAVMEMLYRRGAQPVAPANDAVLGGPQPSGHSQFGDWSGMNVHATTWSLTFDQLIGLFMRVSKCSMVGSTSGYGDCSSPVQNALAHVKGL